jgi:hypothetical protein
MKKILFFPVFFLFLWSCTAPRVVTRITPEAPEGHMAMGREYIPLGNEQIDVELAFDGIHDKRLVFDFVVFNGSSDSLGILPSNFYYVLLNSALSDSSSLPPRLAVHPEVVLTHYDQTLEERKKDKGLNTFMGLLEAGFGILVNTTAFIVTEDPGCLADAVLSTIGTADHYISNDKMIETEMTLISEEKQVVNEEIFRECRIAPGQSMSGYVYFPEHVGSTYYMFCFPIEEQLFQFVYNQQKELVYD